ncbi:MAG: tetratricopeptide repeat protein [Verrucomicrobia bacterium]|nr:tetratricopeptide repeat protein [Verrucomicrobiota bacterium]
MENTLLKEDLRREIEASSVIAIVGAGVSVGATNNNPIASWTGLLHHGVNRCFELKQITGVDDKWVARVNDEIESGDLDDMLSAAEKISRKLGAPEGGEYTRWLLETTGKLKAERRDVLEALRDLNIAVATTNYDGLIEEITRLRAVTWMDGARIERAVRGTEQAVLHLHGYWDRPESVILGIRSYEKVLGDAHAQAMLRAIRSLKTLLFVGCGEGLRDPNLGALLEWSAKVFAGSEYRHFRLALESEVAKLQAQHRPEQRIVVLSYGVEHGDLAAFLRSLRIGVTPGRSVETRTDVWKQATSLPAAPMCFGRDKEIEDLVSALLADTPEPVPLLGPPGIGKTTITLVALHHQRLADRYGKRRFFVRCDSATSRELLAVEIARTIGLEVGPNLEANLLAMLESAPAALALDNVETPWEADTLSVEEFLAEIAGVPGLALIASLRGAARPGGVKWRQAAIEPRQLPLPEARKVFLAIAGAKFTSARHLDDLLGALDGVPLAITLLAYAAQGEPDNMSGFWSRWQQERTRMLQKGKADHRLLSIEVSYKISIDGPRMTSEALRLLTLLGCLPDGIAHKDLDTVCPAFGNRAASVLRQSGLAFDEPDRLRMLAPLRAFVHEKHPPQSDDLGRAIAHYLGLATCHGKKIGQEGGAEAVARLRPEISNLDGMILNGLDLPDPDSAILAALRLGSFIGFTGLGTTAPLEKAVTVAEKQNSKQSLAADCMYRLGEIALRRSDYQAAQQRFEQALPLYERVGSVLGQANCIMSLGEIALERSEHDTARQRFKDALPLYKSVSNVLGEANCIRGLGDVALALSDHDTARRCFECALPLYESASSILGQANCIRALGEIAVARSDYDTAHRFYERAFSLFDGVGDILGQGNCIKGLAEIALIRSKHDMARRLYEQGFLLLKGVGDILGQANCIKGLGDVALAQSDPDTAMRMYGDALTFYQKIPDLYSVGWMHRYLARLARNDDERWQHVTGAANAWRSNRYEDLIRDLFDEFGQT